MDFLIENLKDGTLLVLIPEGDFLFGDEKIPSRLPAYYLAIHPITNAQYRLFDTSRAIDDQRPVTRIGWYKAREYCQWAGLRLPTEQEWEKGARGTDGRKYPWGEKWRPDNCRNNRNGDPEDITISGQGLANPCPSVIWKYEAGASPESYPSAKRFADRLAPILPARSLAAVAGARPAARSFHVLAGEDHHVEHAIDQRCGLVILKSVER